MEPHFWHSLDTGVTHNASDNAAFHIQHVVRHPEKYGMTHDEIKNFVGPEVRDQLDSGDQSVHADLEHHLMQKGWVRGYSGEPEEREYPDGMGGANFRKGFIHADAATHGHAAKFLKSHLPTIKDWAKKTPGKLVNIDLSVGHRYSPTRDYFSADTVEEVERFIDQHHPSSEPKVEPKAEPKAKKETPKAKKETPKAKEETPREVVGFGQMSTTQQSNLQRSLQQQGTPRWQAWAKSGMTSESYKHKFQEEMKKKKKK